MHVAAEKIPGQRNDLLRLSSAVLRQAKSGPTPVRKRRRRPIGILTLLKKGGPTEIFMPRIACEKTGNIVPQNMAKQATTRIRLLKRKALSRDSKESSRRSPFK